MEKQKLKNMKGITLVALTITIIILLILAGITISQLSGSGVFEKAKEARDKWQNAQNEEEIQIAKYNNEIESYIEGDRTLTNAEKMMKPNTWPVGVEQDFGDGIYGYRMTGNSLYNVTMTSKTLFVHSGYYGSGEGISDTYPSPYDFWVIYTKTTD